MPRRWDIFCRVIDNYGDIGVCWRLSRQLAAEYGISVRLWVDNIASLHRICPAIDPNLTIQYQQGVEVRHWIEPFPIVVPAEVVIEAFGCALPTGYIAAMSQYVITAQTNQPPVWINLEYLSAEPWVERYHGLPSPHPTLPLTKYFFFPGFTAATGGLIREKYLLKQQTMHHQDSKSFWKQLGLPHPGHGETTVSLFCYDNPPIDNLLDAWAASPTLVRCLLPEGKVLTNVTHWWSERKRLIPGDIVQRGNLSLHVLPFLSQENYDYLLWSCDCNFVRGEDSFVRAQWAAKPLIWQIYPQQNDAHRMKLEAFLDRYCRQLAADTAAVLRAFYLGWNCGGRLNWAEFWQHQAALQTHAKAWAEQMLQISDLASSLVNFGECKKH